MMFPIVVRFPFTLALVLLVASSYTLFPDVAEPGAGRSEGGSVSSDPEDPDVVYVTGSNTGVRWEVSAPGSGCTTASCGSHEVLDPSDGAEFVFRFPASATAALVEIRYEAHSPLSDLVLGMGCTESSSSIADCQFEASGDDYLRIELDRDELDAAGVPLAQGWVFDVDTGRGQDVAALGVVSVAANLIQSYDGAISVFSEGPVPREYTALVSD